MADTHSNAHADPHVSAPITTLNPPDDREITTRGKIRRVVSVIIVSAVCLFVPMILGNILGSLFGSFGSQLLGLAGFVGGGIFLSLISKRLFVYNEEWKAYVTNNPFGGQNVPYGPGLHFSHLWEQRNKDGEYDLSVISKTFELKAQTQSANVTVTGSFQYRIDLANITKFIGVNPTTVENGLIAFIKSFLTQRLAQFDAEGARKNLGDINSDLKHMFVDEASEIEVKYGIQTVNLFLETIQLPEEAQKTRNAVDETEQLMVVAAKISGYTTEAYQKKRESGEISDERHMQFLNRAMAVSDNKTSINVNVIEGSGSGNVMPMLPLKN
jgi:hypothetical protein